MIKYHINPTTGNPAKCVAKHKCKYGGISGTANHFESKEDARNFYAKKTALFTKNDEKMRKTFERVDKKIERINSFIANANKNNISKEELLEKFEERRLLQKQLRSVHRSRILNSANASVLGVMETIVENPFAKTATMNRVNKESFTAPFKNFINFNNNISPELEKTVIRQLSAWSEISYAEAKKQYYAYDANSNLTKDEYVVSLFQKGGPEVWKKPRVVIDLETTGINSSLGEIIEVGYLIVSPSGDVIETFEERYSLEDKEWLERMGTGPVEVHHIEKEDLIGKETISSPRVQEKLSKVLLNDEYVFVAHNDVFEREWLSQNIDGFWEKTNLFVETGDESEEGRITWLDTKLISTILSKTERNNLSVFTESNGVPYENAHSALPDAIMTNEALRNFSKRLRSSPIGKRPV